MFQYSRYVGGALLCATLGVSVSWAAPVKGEKKDTAWCTPPVVVTGKVCDADLARRVDIALLSDRFLLADHITVMAINGVVTLEGLVPFYDDELRAKRISENVPGVKRVINDLEMYGYEGG